MMLIPIPLSILLFPPFGCLLGILLAALGLFMTIYSTEVAHIVGATISGIVSFALAGKSTVRILFELLALVGLVPADFTAVPTFTLECTVAYIRRKMYLLMFAPFIPALGESLDL
jgi:hypothetical protein